MNTFIGGGELKLRIATWLPRLATTFAIACGIASSGLTQTVTPISWGNTDGNWSDTSKWTGGAVPGGNSYASFNDATGRTVTINTSPNISGIDFGSSAGSYTIQVDGSARTLTIGSYGLRTASSNLEAISGANLTLNLNAIQVNGSSGLSISAPITISSNSLDLSGSGAGSSTISSVIGQTVTNGLTMRGHGTWTLSPTSSNTYTGTTSISAGSLALDFTNLATPTSVISISSALSMSGGALSISGKSSGTAPSLQTFNGTTFSAGASSIAVTPGGTNSATLTLGAISRTVGGTVNFTLPANVTLTTTGADRFLGGWATVNGTDWAVVSSLNLAALASYTNDAWAGSNNTTVTDNTTSTLSANSTTQSLRFNDSSSRAVTINSGVTGIISSGGILVTSNAGASSISAIDGTSTLKGANGVDLVVIQNSSNALSIGAVIADNGSATGLTKSGTGNLVLSGANTYTGKTNINGGNVTVDSGAALGTGAGGLTMLENTTLNLNNAAQILNGLGGSGAIVLGSGHQLTINPPASPPNPSSIYTGVISGDGSLIKTGSNTLTLSGANIFTGGSTISAGTIKFSSGSLGGSGAITMSGGTLQWNTSNTQDVSARVTMVNATTATFDTNGNNVAFATGIGSGTSGALTKSGSGTLTLSGTSTYTGATNISTGTVQFAVPAALYNSTTGSLHSPSSLYVATGATAAFNIGGSGEWTTGNINTLRTNVDFQNGSRLGLDTTNAGGVVNYTYAISDPNSHPLWITKLGTGTLTLSAANTYTGSTTINAGTLQIGVDSALPNSPLILNGGTLALGGAFTDTIGTLQLTASSTIDFGSFAATLNFGDSHTPNWSGGTTLSITNYVTSGSHLYFGSDSTALSSTQLSKITINGSAASWGSGGEIISAIPEPSTYAAILGAVTLGLAMYRRQRRASPRLL